MLIGIAIEMPFALGEMLLGLEVTLNAVGKIKTDKIQAYFIRDWRTLQMVSYLPLLGDLIFDMPFNFLFKRFAGAVVGCSGVGSLAGWGWKNKRSKLYCQVLSF